MSSLPCATCGSTEFTCHSGYFICNTCDTHSQEIVDQRFEYNDFSRVVDDSGEEREVVPETSIAAERDLTSWECYNIVLRSLVDELINLGASKEIKILAFQLWALYLRKSNVAFISKNEEKLPALSLGFRNKDVNAIYGVPNLRKKLFNNAGHAKRSRKRKYSCSDSDSVSSYRIINAKKRKVEMEKIIPPSESSASEFETLESLEKERDSLMSKKKEIVFKSSAMRVLNKFIGKSNKPSCNSSGRKKPAKKPGYDFLRLVYDRRYKTSTEKGPNVPITSVTIITILRIALQLANDQIYLGDILRWICEGRLSVNQPEKFVPSFYLHVKKHDLFSIQRRGFQLDIRNFTFNLNLSDLPTPNLFKLAERYCSELCVPYEFTRLVIKLMVHSKVEMNYAKYEFRIFPDYESRVMALILFVFKLLFSLDDYTECQQSAFADAVNELRQSQEKEGIPKLFSLNSWMRFIECRKAVLAQYNAPISQLAYDDVNCEKKVFLDYWEKVKPLYEATERKINNALMSSLSQKIHSLSFEDATEEDMILLAECPASITPLLTYTEHLLKNHPDSLPLQSKEILSEDFRSYSIKHAMDSEWCSSIAEKLGLKAESCCQKEEFNLEIYDRENHSLPFLCNSTVPTNRLVPVFIENIEVSTAASNNELETYQCHLSDCQSGTVDSQSQPSGLKICNSSSYWCLHETVKISVEEFDAVGRRQFPRSFLWLLRECASMLRMDVKELYMELINVENILHDLQSITSKKGSFLKVIKNEW